MTKTATSRKRYTTAGGFVAAFLGFGTAVTGAAPAVAASSSPSPDAVEQARARRLDGTAVTGTTGSRVRAAVLEQEAGATVLRLETSGGGYQGRITTASGDRRTVLVSAGFAVTGTLTAGHVGDGRQGRRLPPLAAAAVLGMTESELRAKLASGATLTQVAATTGMSRTALVAALVAAQRAAIAADVTAGTLTQAQADTQLAGSQAIVTSQVGQVQLGRAATTGTSPTSVPALTAA